MNKILSLTTAVLLFSASYAHDGKECSKEKAACCKKDGAKKECCKKDSKKSTDKTTSIKGRKA